MEDPPTPKTLREALAQNAMLRELVSALQEANAELKGRVAQLEAKVEILEGRANRNSKNSSQPPSSDPPDVKVGPKRKPSGRKPGGQPGHRGHQRALLDPEKVSHFEDYWPEKCEQCRQSLCGGGALELEPVRHQVIEIPPMQAPVTEHRLHTLVCERCEHATTAELPSDVPRGAFGPRLVAIVALMAGGYRLSKRTIATALEDLFGVQMSLGAVSACEQSQSTALANAVAEAAEYVRQQAAVYADETGWRQRRARAWLWVAATPLITVFLVHRRRNGNAAWILLQGLQGILVSDRWSSYLQWALKQRQLCWAHLKRDFHFISERGPEVAWIGEELLQRTAELFSLWHRVRDGTLARSTFRERVRPIRAQIELLLELGSRCDHGKVSGMCRELLAVQEAMWTFVRVAGVEPTNNLAERALRHAVLWRKASFGTHSLRGSRFVERMLTVVTSLRQQNRCVLEYLAQANQARLAGTRAPSLLPKAA